MKNLTRIAVLAFCFAVAIFASSCKTQYDLMLDSNDVAGKYKMAFELFEAKKYVKAAAMFESLKLAVRGTAQDDTVQYYAAYSNYRYGDVIAAEQGFESFFTTFPRSPFTLKSRFLYLDCLYRSTYRYELDQTPTYKTLTEIAEFLTDYPDSEYTANCNTMVTDLEGRLDRKEYESAKLYYMTEDYKAAQYALRLVLKENPANIYREDIMYYTAMASFKYADNSIAEKQKDRFMTFQDDYLTFVSEYPESKYRNQLDGLAARAQKFVNKKK